MNEADVLAAIADQARLFNLPEPLLEAVARVESGLCPYAMRYEPKYRWLWNIRTSKPYFIESAAQLETPADFPHTPKLSSRSTEFIGQKISWGALQIMGATAREHGFRGRFPELAGAMGIHYGAKYLAHLRGRYLGHFGWRGVVAAYNAGTPRVLGDGRYENQDYVDKVWWRIKTVPGAEILL